MAGPALLRLVCCVAAIAGGALLPSGPARAQMSVEREFRDTLGDLNALRGQLGEDYASGAQKIETFSDRGSQTFTSPETYRAIFNDWMERGGPSRGRDIETALDRDPLVHNRLSAPRDSSLTPFVVGIGARIVGQNAQTAGQRFRETVAILQTRGAGEDDAALSGLCTGVLVSDLTVLTAAHCVCDLDLLSADGRATAVVVYDSVADRRGKYLLAPIAEPRSRYEYGPLLAGQRSSRIDRTRQPALLDPAFCAALSQGRLLKGSDLALIYLDPDRTAMDSPADKPELVDLIQDRAKAHFAPLELLTSPALQHMTVVGFGISDFISDDRRYWGKVGVRVPVADPTCSRAYAQANYDCAPGREAVLVDGHTGGDTCQGDSGGPAFIRYFGAYYVAGITSRAATGGRCGEGGIYTLITPQVMAWINWRKRVGDPAF
ncbi:trypsin-like serine protease [Stappia sp. 28M-7]|uniref:trypsin-like serine protease n=1 Tax=Stappia sp. 28M-7 TaxID=2762596 RepID=UPI00163CA2FC|nr:trypsin-like serine protease [Stappia sp. 28M-7]MBC2858040.1 trypsin-like serine protease [Stappia sp. 28M-7]